MDKNTTRRKEKAAMGEKNELYWAYNLPLQYWPSDEGESAHVLNYMPRKQRAEMFDLDEMLGEQTHEEFFMEAAAKLRNLALLMERAARDPKFHVYYHDADPTREVVP